MQAFREALQSFEMLTFYAIHPKVLVCSQTNAQGLSHTSDPQTGTLYRYGKHLLGFLKVRVP